jgi:hypothetical protein
MGERSAVRPKSGQSVSQSDPGLRRPTPPSTAGRKPAARPPIQVLSFTSSKLGVTPREAGTSHRKTGRGAGQRPASQFRREAPDTNALVSKPALLANLQDFELEPLLNFFRILDRWDREARGTQPMQPIDAPQGGSECYPAVAERAPAYLRKPSLLSIPSGASQCDLLCQTPFDCLWTPLKCAIAIAIAMLAMRGMVFLVIVGARLADADHHSGCPARSCRLCLIACNSRKFTFRRISPPVPEEIFSGDR